MPVIDVSIKAMPSYEKAVEYGVFPDDGLFHACPVYSTEGAACCDVYTMTDLVIPARGSAQAPAGFAVELPRDYEMTIRPRSGLAFKHMVVSFTGTIDCDYRDEVRCLIFNHSDKEMVLAAGERVCQASFDEVTKAKFNVVAELNPADYSTRTGGFGHTGRKFMGQDANKTDDSQIDLPLE